MNSTMKKLFLPIVVFLLLVAVFLFFWLNKDKHTIRIESEDGVVLESFKVMRNGLLEVPEAPKKEGYLFLYWTLNGEEFDFNTRITGDMVLIPMYQMLGDPGEGQENIIEYLVAFNSDGGNEVESQIVKQDEKAIKPENPTKKGYVFKYWMLGDAEFDFETIITSDIVLKASWKKEKETSKPQGSTGTSTPTPTPTPKPTPTPPKPTPEPKYTVEYKTYMMASPQQIVIVKKDGKVVSAKAILSSSETVLGEYSSEAKAILIDTSEKGFAAKIKLSDNSIVKISK